MDKPDSQIKPEVSLDDKCLSEAMDLVKKLTEKYSVDYTAGEPSNYRLSANSLIGSVAHDYYKNCIKR